MSEEYPIRADITTVNLETITEDTFKCNISHCVWSSFGHCFRKICNLEVEEEKANSLDCRFYERFIPIEELIAKRYCHAIKMEQLKLLIDNAILNMSTSEDEE